MTPRIEIWNSNQNQEERHYFMPEDPNTYIFGFNPQLISSQMAEYIVNMILSECSSASAKKP